MSIDAPAARVATRLDSRTWRILLLTGVATMVPSINLSVMYVVYPEIQKAFPRASAGELSWIFSGYTIVSAATMVMGGVIADRTGRKRALIVGTAIVALSVALCGAAPNVGVLIAARILVAIGSSLLIPATTSLALRAVPATRRSWAFGVLASFGGVSAAAAPSLGAAIIDAGGWRWAFYSNLPLALVVLALAPSTYTESKDPESRKLPDPLGAVLLAAGLGAAILAVVQSPKWGWASGSTIGALAIGVALLAAVIVRSARHRNPFLEVGLFRFRTFSILNASSFFISIAWFGMFFVLTQFLRNTWDYGLVQAGVLVSPVPFGAGVLGPIAGRIADRIGYRTILLAGAVAFAAGALWMLAVVPDTPSVIRWLPGISLIGIGTGLVFPAVQGGSVIDMPSERYATASSLNHTIQRVGSAVGNAVAIMFVAASGAAIGFDRMFVIVLVASLLILPTGFTLSRERPARA